MAVVDGVFVTHLRNVDALELCDSTSTNGASVDELTTDAAHDKVAARFDDVISGEGEANATLWQQCIERIRLGFDFFRNRTSHANAICMRGCDG